MSVTRRFRSCRVVLAAVALSAAMAVTGTTLAAGVASADQPDDAGHAAGLVNDARLAVGDAPLVVDGGLTAIAQDWANQLAAGGYLAHNPDIAVEMGNWWAWGENVGEGPSIDVLQDALLNSPHHYANMVDPAFTSLGVGVAYGDGGELYLVEDFGG